MLSEENPIQMFKKIDLHKQQVKCPGVGIGLGKATHPGFISNENIWTQFLHDSDLF